MNRTSIFFVLVCTISLGANELLVAQTTSNNFSSSITAEEIERFGDFTVEEALARIPGIQVDRDGKINLRGVGQQSYYVTVDGQRMGTTGLGDRSANLSAISVDMIKEVEFIKVLTPEMDADGLAGVINLKTYQAHRDESSIRGGFGGGLSPEYQNRIGPTGRAWLGYSGPLSETISMALNANYQRDYTAWQSLGMSYGAEDFGNGPVDVVNRISPGFQISGNDRLAGTLNLDFISDEQTKLYLRSMVNADFHNSERHRTNWISNSSWNDQTTTGAQGSFGYDAETVTSNLSQYTISAGGEHLFDALKLSFNAGWSRSEVDQKEYIFPFLATGIEYGVDFSDRTRPLANPINGEPSSGDLRLQNMTFIINNQIDRKITGNIDVEIPFDLGTVKLGTSTLLTEKDAKDKGAYSKYIRRFGFPPLTLNDFEKDEHGSLSVFDDRYELGRLVDSDEAEFFYQSSIPNLRLEAEDYFIDSPIKNYFGEENIYAGYGMVSLQFSQLNVVAGIRAEHTQSDYEARRVIMPRFGSSYQVSDTSSSGSYTNIFPNAQLAFQLNDQSTISLAYSRSMDRPDFEMLSPFELVVPRDTLIYKGNINLKPAISDNLDLRLDYAISDEGAVSFSGFYKNLTDFTYLRTQEAQIQLGQYPVFDGMFEAGENEMTVTERSFQNSENTATVFGIELSLQQQLTFLPGLFSNLSAYANYTWSLSEFESERGENTALPGHSPHVVNAALNYSQNKFSAQLSYHWSAELLSSLENNRRLAPSISGNEIYLDRYQDGYQNLGATFSYQLSGRSELWANVYNLLPSEQVEYAHSRDFYPTSIYKQEGIEFNVGIRFNL